MWTRRPSVVSAALTEKIRLDYEWLLLAVALIGLILLGLYVVVRLRRRLAEQKQPTLPMRIEDYRALLERGLLEPQEFERIRDKLEQKTASPPAPASAPASAPSADPTAIQSFEPPRPQDPRPKSTGIQDLEAGRPKPPDVI
jgi:hypothetical protein